MKEFFIKMILSVDETVNIIVMIISIVSGIVAIIEEIQQKKGRKNKWIWKCIFIVSFLTIVCTVVRSKVTVVPNVVGKTYQDACAILSSNGLNYNLIIDDGVYVMEQNPVAGTPVKRGTQIELVTQPIGNNPQVREMWECSLGVDFGNIAISFKEKKITLTDEGECKECFGIPIADYSIKQAYLLEENVGVEYHDYVIEDNVLIFKDIPQGIPFQLIVLLEGFERMQTEVVVSSQNMENGTYSFSWMITRNDAEMLLPVTFYVADYNKSSISHVEYMSNVKLHVLWPEKVEWRGDYFTNVDGRFPYAININENQKIKVKIINPFDNGVDYECEVMLYALKIGEPSPTDIIFLKEDGTCEVINTREYFAW